jgi:hypothetical protein
MRDMRIRGNRTWRIILWVVLPVVFCVALFIADGTGLTYLLVPVTGDEMDWESHYLAGLTSRNCGRVKVGESASQTTQCALAANAKGKAFRAIYDIQGIDSLVAGGIVRTHDGKLLALTYEGCPEGCGFSMLLQRVWVQPCPQPYQLYVNPKNRINCFQPRILAISCRLTLSRIRSMRPKRLWPSFSGG